MPHDPQTLRSDRVLLTVLAVILAMVGVTFGAAANYRPAPAATATAVVRALSVPAQDTVLTGLIAEHRCLTEALYYEARGEGSRGEKAVAEVVFHRMNAGRFGHSICAVVYEGAGHPGCQFSFTCDGSMRRPREAAAWRKSEALAAQILTGGVALRNVTGGATHYHAVWMYPGWAPTLEETAHIGRHIFYRGGHGRESQLLPAPLVGEGGAVRQDSGG